MRLATCSAPDGSQGTYVAPEGLDGWFLSLDKLSALQNQGQRRSAVPPDALVTLIAGENPLYPEMEVLRSAALGMLEKYGLEDLAAAEVAVSEELLMFAPPVPRPSQMLFIGQNYGDHADEVSAETRRQDRAAPTFFAKLPSGLIGHAGKVNPPAFEPLLDYEVELGVVIGRPCHNVAADEALELVAGYAVVNDLTARETQMREMERGSILFGKNFAGSSPMGPWLVTPSAIPDPQDLWLRCDVDSENRQEGHTSNMRYSVAELISIASAVPLQPGDVIGTGTPAGVAWLSDRRDDFLLKPGQVVRSSIEAIGSLETRIGTVGGHK